MKQGDINTRRDGEEPQAPEKLVAALKELPARRVFVPPAIDSVVLLAAHRRLARPQRSGPGAFRFWLNWPVWAAACLAVLGLVFLFVKPAAVTPAIARMDVNHDGRVDILDAFQLARELQAGRKVAAGLDLNGDGVVDQRDVEILAAQAVTLKKGGRS
ncbi:MAG TPA: dockerin type I domain-containing protein [Verrucomicrobiae bacterium]|nr:dockerin type I domain-containing protein [Verrucomicrobiae bacterium]